MLLADLTQFTKEQKSHGDNTAACTVTLRRVCPSFPEQHRAGIISYSRKKSGYVTLTNGRSRGQEAMAVRQATFTSCGQFKAADYRMEKDFCQLCI